MSNTFVKMQPSLSFGVFTVSVMDNTDGTKLAVLHIEGNTVWQGTPETLMELADVAMFMSRRFSKQ